MVGSKKLLANYHGAKRRQKLVNPTGCW